MMGVEVVLEAMVVVEVLVVTLEVMEVVMLEKRWW